MVFSAAGDVEIRIERLDVSRGSLGMEASYVIETAPAGPYRRLEPGHRIDLGVWEG